MKNITIIAADEGQNLKLAQQIKNQLDQLTTTTTLIDLISLQLPLYTLSLEKEQGIPTQAKELYDQFTNSNGNTRIQRRHSPCTQQHHCLDLTCQ
jgi:NAD(P)H-dependent FMN reductase